MVRAESVMIPYAILRDEAAEYLARCQSQRLLARFIILGRCRRTHLDTYRAATAEY
jgi:hypothetical protein